MIKNVLKLMIFSVIVISVSCVVPKKKYCKMMDQRDSLQFALNNATYKLDTLIPLVKNQRDTIQLLRKEVASLNDKISTMTTQYNNLSENYNKLRANSSDEIKKLLAQLETAQNDILEREKRLKEVEDAMRKREESMTALRDKLAKALLGFKNSGLTVNIKDGKVYVSLTDKLLFDTGSIEIDQKGKDALQEIAKVLKTQPDINVLVEGHTDNVKVANLGQIKDNWDLSVLRATSVVRYLTDVQKLESNRVTASGKGEYLPVEANTTVQGKSKNRRIELILTPKLDELYQMLDNKTDSN